MISVLLLVAFEGLLGASSVEPHALIVVGLGGTEEYSKRFEDWSARIQRILAERGLPEGNSLILKPEGPAAAVSRKENIDARFRMLTRLKPEDSFWLFLIGHGSARGERYQMNIPGPDLTDQDLARWMDAVPARRQALINTTSASGAVLPALSRKHRVVITATRTGREEQVTHFAEFFLEALEAEGADQDKSGQVSLLEAFLYADRKVADWYKSQTRLASEHALLDDDGDGEGSREVTPESGEGRIAANFFLFPAPAGPGDREQQPLHHRKRELEAQIRSLRFDKAALSPQEYDARLEALLLQLAETEEQLERANQKPQP